MGIDGLHSVMKPYMQQFNVSQLQGRRVGVDASGWLHRRVRTRAGPAETAGSCPLGACHPCSGLMHVAQQNQLRHA